MYMPLLGVLFIIAFLLLRVSEKRYTTMYTLSSIILLILSFGSFHQSQLWKNTYTLFTYSLQQDESFLAYEKVGSELLEMGRTQEAIVALKKSIELAPNSAAFVRLGVAAEEAKNWEDAKVFYLEALSSSPEHAQAHTNLGRIYWDEGKQLLAIDHMEQAVENHKWNMMALGNLASMYTLTGQNEKAIEIIDWILVLEPNNERVRPLMKKLGVIN
jgi:tetratricopeptide (TPR) repeat protein